MDETQSKIDTLTRLLKEMPTDDPHYGEVWNERAELKRKQTEHRAKTFQELEAAINGEGMIHIDARRFAEWLDEHGYKTFPDMPDYVS